MTRFVIRLTFCMGLFTGALCHAAGAGFIAVDIAAEGAGDGTPAHPFNTLKAALEKAASGDTIRIAKGVYSENIAVDKKSFSMRGGYPGAGDFEHEKPSGNLTEIHAADPKASVLKFSNVESGRISGLKLTGGLHGIELINCQELEISDNIVDGNGSLQGPYGGGICLVGVKKISIRNNEILNNKAADDGGGIGYKRGKPCTDMVIENNHFVGNAVAGEHGGGLFILGTGAITKNVFEHNTSLYGSGMFLDGGAFVCSYNVVRNNSSHGIFTIDYTHKGNELCHTLDHNLIYGNKWGIGTFWSSQKIVNCTIADNASGAFEKRDDPNMTVTIVNTIFWHNQVSPKGLAISYSMAETDLPGAGNIKGDPLFASADKSAPDYHLKAAGGRWTAAANPEWLKDSVTSPAIAAGDPESAASKQLPPGVRVELGAYGNSPEASKPAK
jgi:hypothetical protein